MDTLRKILLTVAACLHLYKVCVLWIGQHHPVFCVGYFIVIMQPNIYPFIHKKEDD